jgi:hypothetical protein
MELEQLLTLATTLVLAGAIPIAVIAARGFRGAPFGAVLRPLPVVLVGYVALNASAVVEMPAPIPFALVMSSVATVGALVSAAHVLVLLTERRKL